MGLSPFLKRIFELRTTNSKLSFDLQIKFLGKQGVRLVRFLSREKRDPPPPPEFILHYQETRSKGYDEAKSAKMGKLCSNSARSNHKFHELKTSAGAT